MFDASALAIDQLADALRMAGVVPVRAKNKNALAQRARHLVGESMSRWESGSPLVNQGSVQSWAAVSSHAL